MKILLLSPLPPPSGGIATWTVLYEQYCRERKIPVSIVNNALVGARKDKMSLKRNLLDEVRRTVGIIGRLIRTLHHERPDVIHINTSCSRFGVYRDCICAMISRVYAVPVVVQCHCNIQDQIRDKAAELAFRVMASISQKVLVLNRFSAEYARQFANVRVTVIPNFMTEAAVFERKSVAEEIRQVVFVGHVRKEKGVEEILKAAAQLRDVRFTLIGPVQQDLDGLVQSDNVDLLGTQPHGTVLELLKQADAFLFPSYTEGFANAMLEAMAAGLPIIATDVGANAEMIENQGGLIVPTGDVDAIVGAINELKNDPPRRLAMGSWNMKKVKSEYLLDVVMKQLMEIYSSVCQAKE